VLVALSRGGDPFGAAPSGALQQAFPEGEVASAEGLPARTKTRRSLPRQVDGDDDAIGWLKCEVAGVQKKTPPSCSESSTRPLSQ